MRRICFYGGPGSGKSTIAAGLFSHLKRLGHNVELVPEYIKTWAYLNTPAKSFDQLYVLAKQLRQEDILLRSGVDYIISDSPLGLQLAYMKKHKLADLYDELFSIAKKFDIQFPSLNIWLDRKNIPYRHTGRWETYDEAIQMDEAILDVVNDMCDHYATQPADNHSNIIDFVLRHI